MTVKNYADLGGCYPPQPSASVDNILLDLHNSSHPTLPRSIIVNCRTFFAALPLDFLKVLVFPVDYATSSLVRSLRDLIEARSLAFKKL